MIFKTLKQVKNIESLTRRRCFSNLILTSEYYNKVYQENWNLTEIKHKRIEHKGNS